MCHASNEFDLNVFGSNGYCMIFVLSFLRCIVDVWMSLRLTCIKMYYNVLYVFVYIIDIYI